MPSEKQNISKYKIPGMFRFLHSCPSKEHLNEVDSLIHCLIKIKKNWKPRLLQIIKYYVTLITFIKFK